MDWEESDVVEETEVEPTPAPSKASKSLLPKEEAKALPKLERQSEPVESDDEPSSADEYVAEEKPKALGKVRLILAPNRCSNTYSYLRFLKRRARRLAISESDSEGPDHPGGRSGRLRRKSSGSPGPSNLKRKSKVTAAHPPPSKRKKSESTPTDDPTRKYCLGKLEEVFCQIFIRYPHIKDDDDKIDDNAMEGDGNGEGMTVEKKSEDLTDEEKAKLEDKAKKFAIELEQCVYDIYSDHDKQGKATAGPKYKYDYFSTQFDTSMLTTYSSFLQGTFPNASI